jgi:hypothetical protein
MGQQQPFFQEFCEKVVALDPSIRFVGIADGHGELKGTAERKGLKPLLTPEERAQYAITAANRQFTRLRWEYLLGKINYATSHYSKLIRATIPIADENNRLYYVLLLSFDVESGSSVHDVIMKKVIPLVRKNAARFLKNNNNNNNNSR